jgi:hypothetical protein
VPAKPAAPARNTSQAGAGKTASAAKPAANRELAKPTAPAPAPPPVAPAGAPPPTPPPAPTGWAAVTPPATWSAPPAAAATAAPAWTAQPWSGFAAPPPPALRPVQGLAGALVILVLAVVAFTALDLALLAMLPEWGSPFATGPLAAVDQLLSVLASGLSIAAVVVFCIWLYRVMANARQRHPMAEISPGWAVGSFFIPVVHLFAPYFAIRRAWQADVSEDEGPLAAWFWPWSLSTLVGYVAGVLVVTVAFQSVFEGIGAGDEGPDLEGLWEDLRPVQLAVGAVALVLQVLAAVFLARVVRRWSALQEGRPVS